LALSESERLILVAVLAVVMTFVVYYEMRVIRNKGKVVRQAGQKRDEAYNNILTTRSVMNSLTNQGKSTGNAPVLLERARSAMDRGDYDRCVDLCSKARSELTKPSKPSSLEEERVDAEAGDSLQEVAENILSESIPPADADQYKGTKLNTASEGNYLGAKFEMSAAKADISRAAKSGLEVSEAETLMAQAETSYTGCDYDKALSFALRARKAISSEAARETIPLRRVARKKKPEPEVEPEVYDVEGETTPSGFPCPNCGKLLDPTDIFCGNCGARLSKERDCKSCGATSKPEDTFCRKCGERI
jgi:hypothetical protein